DWDAEWYIEYDVAKPLTQEFIEARGQGSAPDQNNFAANLGSLENMWHQDRVAMKDGHFSGLTKSVAFEDFIVQESMGSQVDRSIEQLAPSDAIVVRVRRMLLEGVREFQAGKPAPWQDGVDYSAVRAVAMKHPTASDWRDCVPATPPMA